MLLGESLTYSLYRVETELWQDRAQIVHQSFFDIIFSWRLSGMFASWLKENWDAGSFLENLSNQFRIFAYITTSSEAETDGARECGAPRKTIDMGAHDINCSIYGHLRDAELEHTRLGRKCKTFQISSVALAIKLLRQCWSSLVLQSHIYLHK